MRLVCAVTDGVCALKFCVRALKFHKCKGTAGVRKGKIVVRRGMVDVCGGVFAVGKGGGVVGMGVAWCGADVPAAQESRGLTKTGGVTMFYDSPTSYFDAGGTYDSVSSPSAKKKPMAKPKLELQRKDFQETLDLVNVILTAMTGNPTFGSPNPTLASTTTLKNTAATKLAAYNSAVAAVATALSDRDVAFENLRAGLTQLAAYVDNIANGDRVKIESAGMPVRNDPDPISELAPVENLTLDFTEFEGALHASWDQVRGAGAYEIQASVDPVTPTSWAFKDISTTITTVLKDFTSGTKMWIRIRAVGLGNERGPLTGGAGTSVP